MTPRHTGKDHPHPETTLGTNTVLLPTRADREDKFHRPLVSGAQLPVCGTFENAGVEQPTDDLLVRGYRPCRLCWPDRERGAPGFPANIRGEDG